MEFKIEIADICTQISFDDDDFAGSLIMERYYNFLSDKPPSMRLNIEVRPIEDPSLLDGTGKAVEHSLQGNTFYFCGLKGDIEGRLSLSTGKAEGVTIRVPYRFDALLRVLYSLWLVKSGGFLLHAAGMRKDREAYIFFGASGSGKTTVTRLSADRKVILSDELVAVRAAEGQYQAYGTPFMGEFAKGGENCSGDIRRIFLLKKDTKNFLLPMNRVQALKELFRCVQFFGEKTPLMTDLFTICCDFAEKVLFYEMHFLPDRSFWNCLRN